MNAHKENARPARAEHPGGRFTVPPHSAGATLKTFLAEQLRVSGNKAKSILDARAVLVNNRRVWMARHALRAGDEIILQETGGPPPTPLSVLLEDDHLLVVDKPPAILSTGPNSLETALQRRTGSSLVRVAHRLDRDTSGCLLAAKTPETFDRIVGLFRQRRVVKIYRAIIFGRLAQREATVNQPLDRRPAITRLRVLDANRKTAHLELLLETGLTHQIRRHLRALDCVIAGDRLYLPRREPPEENLSAARQMLHAYRLRFPHPIHGQTVRVQAPLPRDFQSCLRRFDLT